MYGYTALIRACYRGHDNIVELLINANADLNIPDNVWIHSIDKGML